MNFISVSPGSRFRMPNADMMPYTALFRAAFFARMASTEVSPSSFQLPATALMYCGEEPPRSMQYSIRYSTTSAFFSSVRYAVAMASRMAEFTGFFR